MRKRKRGGGLIVGPVMVFIALSAIWKNETRFDTHFAAQNTRPISSKEEASSGQLISYTGSMDRQLVLQGEYVDSFTGYLVVHRNAQIYAWNEDTDSDGHTTWRRQWMSRLESNSRNRGLTQELSSYRFLPPEYRVDDLAISSENIEFVDSMEQISPRILDVKHPRLGRSGEYLYMSKGREDNLGDERVSYRGIPVPETATYFGKFSEGQGVADLTHQRTGFIHEIIQDTGVLHHLVAGERKAALDSIKAYISRLKWIVRGIGTLVVIMGFLGFFSRILGIIYFIPFLGHIARAGTFILSVTLGIFLSLITMVTGYFFANPLTLVLMILLISVGILALHLRKRSTQKLMSRDLQNHYGTQVSTMNLKELEFIELAQLALSDGRMDPKEEKFLRGWARKHGWDNAAVDQMLHRAVQTNHAAHVSSEEHVKNLIRLALADGHLSRSELATIQRAAKRQGYDSARIAHLTQEVQQLAAAQQGR